MIVRVKTITGVEELKDNIKNFMENKRINSNNSKQSRFLLSPKGINPKSLSQKINELTKVTSMESNCEIKSKVENKMIKNFKNSNKNSSNNKYTKSSLTYDLSSEDTFKIDSIDKNHYKSNNNSNRKRSEAKNPIMLIKDSNFKNLENFNNNQNINFVRENEKIVPNPNIRDLNGIKAELDKILNTSKNCQNFSNNILYISHGNKKKKNILIDCNSNLKNYSFKYLRSQSARNTSNIVANKNIKIMNNYNLNYNQTSYALNNNINPNIIINTSSKHNEHEEKLKYDDKTAKATNKWNVNINNNYDNNFHKKQISTNNDNNIYIPQNINSPSNLNKNNPIACSTKNCKLNPDKKFLKAFIKSEAKNCNKNANNAKSKLFEYFKNQEHLMNNNSHMAMCGNKDFNSEEMNENKEFKIHESRKLSTENWHEIAIQKNREKLSFINGNILSKINFNYASKNNRINDKNAFKCIESDNNPEQRILN